MASAHSLAGLRKWLGREQWRDAFGELLDRHLAPACANAGIGVDGLAGVIGDQDTSTLWGCVFEDLMAYDFEDGNFADDYLKRRGWKETSPNKAYIAALRTSVMSLYEVSDIVLDQSFLARDLMRGGEPVRVSERSGTHYLKPWDRIAARLVPVDSRFEMAGGALPFEYDASEELLSRLRGARRDAQAYGRGLARKKGIDADGAAVMSDTDVLRCSAFVFTNLWLAGLLRRTLNPALPRMCNTDGDELAFTTVRYPLISESGAEAVRSALDAIPSLRPEDATFWNWIGGKDSNTKDGEVRILTTTLDDGATVLGTIELKDGALILEVNSPARADRGRALLAGALAGLAGEPLIETRTVSDLLASPRDKGSDSFSGQLTPDEEAEAIQASMDRYYKYLLDEPVLMLGNRTPRRAAKSAKGREKLVAWLKYLENGSAKNKLGSRAINYDLSWMWTELGISDLRR